MVASMTGFARKRFTIDGVAYTTEVRTLNHKYLDVHCKLPDTLTALEMPLRNLLKSYISRGRVDIRVTMEYEGDSGLLALNEPVYRAYCEIISAISKQHEVQSVDPIAILSLPNILQGERQDPEQIVQPFLSLLAQALQELAQDRKREGNHLWQDILAKLGAIGDLADQLESYAKEQQEEVSQRFRQRLSRLDEGLDDGRIMTEVAILIDKSDINEELVRLRAHLREFVECGSKKEPIGRRLEFLGQEMLRETNTIAAKSAVYQVSKLAVDIKTELEKIREQVQNIE